MRNDWNVRAAASCLLSLCLLGGAHAERSYGAPPLARYTQECGACHLAYPPGLLPGPSWQRVMAQLGHHFGSDASLEPAAAREIGAWLQAHAGSGRRGGEEPPQDRISKARWFVREHDEIAASTWKRASIGSASQCAACHAGAAEGNFDEHAIRIPK